MEMPDRPTDPANDRALNGPIYALDIETDTSKGGLDPAKAGIIAVAISSAEGDHVISGDEISLLEALDEYIANLAPGIIVTWNGNRFDLPFITTRASIRSVTIGLQNTLVRPDHFQWHGHRHLDALVCYRALRTDPTQSCALKKVAIRMGLDPIVEDAANVHRLTPQRLREYVASDARITRQLACMKWRELQGFMTGKRI